MKLLIVDDVPFMLISLQKLLERHAYDVVTAEEGAEALKLLSSDVSIDAVITDLDMPDMNGIELFHKARTIERYGDGGVLPPVPFVLLTAVEKTGTAQHWDGELRQAKLMFHAILEKPVMEQEIISVLRQMDFELTDIGRVVRDLRILLKDATENVSLIRTLSDARLFLSDLQEQVTVLREDVVARKESVTL